MWCTGILARRPKIALSLAFSCANPCTVPAIAETESARAEISSNRTLRTRSCWISSCRRRNGDKTVSRMAEAMVSAYVTGVMRAVTESMRQITKVMVSRRDEYGSDSWGTI